jgi:hypothetical protein
MPVYTVPPSNSYVILSDMLLVTVLCLLSSRIHVCSLIYVPRMQILNCWSLCILYVPYTLYLLPHLIVQHTPCYMYCIPICISHLDCCRFVSLTVVVLY